MMTPRSTSPAAARPGSVLRELLVDVALPLGLYFLLHAGLGVRLVTALAVSSIPPALRALGDLARARTVNGLAVLMLAVNLVGIGTSFLTGNPRLMFAKDSAVSSVIALAILVSTLAGRPLMSAGLKVFMTRDDPTRTAAWDRLSAADAAFRRCERRYSLIWAAVLLGDCVARLIGAVTLPVSTMSWASTAIILVSVAVGVVISGAAAAGPMQRRLERELAEAGAAQAARPAPARAAWRRRLSRNIA